MGPPAGAERDRACSGTVLAAGPTGMVSERSSVLISSLLLDPRFIAGWSRFDGCRSIDASSYHCGPSAILSSYKRFECNEPDPQ